MVSEILQGLPPQRYRVTAGYGFATATVPVGSSPR